MRRRQEKTAASEEEKILQLITPAQQRFIEALLAGSTITAAASIAGISRRTAHYWMDDPQHPVRNEYEHQRHLQQQEMTTRVSSIRTKALEALEDLLSPNTPPFLRLGAVRMVYDACLHDLLAQRETPSSVDLVSEGARAYFEESQAHASNQIALYDNRGRERLPDDDD